MKWNFWKRNIWLSVLLGLTGVVSYHGALAWERVGVFVGSPYPYYPYAYPAPYYYPQPVVVTPPEPPVYIQQQQAQPATSYWYHCDKPEGYYPYVQQCPGGWKAVLPPPQQPPH